MTAPKPMPLAEIRRLMASGGRPDALLSQRLQEAEANGRLAGLLMVAAIHHRRTGGTR